MKSIRHTATLYYYDGPQVFEASDGIGGQYIGVMVDPDGSQDQYLVARVEPARLRQFRSGTLDLRSLLTERGENEWFLAKTNGGLDAPLTLQPQASPLTTSSYLPEAGFLLHDLPESAADVLAHAGLDCFWGVGQFVLLVSSGNPNVAIRTDNGEAWPVKELEMSAERTWHEDLS
jgi:hypothetical protein